MKLMERRGTSTTRVGLKVLVLAGVVAFTTGTGSCNLDPVHQSAVNALGPERSADYPPESEYHRPGEPCSLCHSDKGPAESNFVLGGTIFWGPDDYENRVDNAFVRVLDAEGKQKCFVTNCNGNFYVRRADFANITFPLLVSVERTVDPSQGASPTLVIRRMSSHIGRESSCATCHIQGLRDFASPGQIRLFNSEAEFKAKNVPIVACPPPDSFKQVLQCPEDR